MKIKEILSYVSIIAIIILIRTFVVTPIRVNQESMYDTLKPGDIMILKKYARSSVNRFDIVVVKEPSEKTDLIKRVIGLPEEDIEYKDGVLYINGNIMEDKYKKSETKDFKDYCGKDEYFVMGDNRAVSKDSRDFGCIKKDQILGKTDLIVFPFSRIGKVK